MSLTFMTQNNREAKYPGVYLQDRYTLLASLTRRALTEDSRSTQRQERLTSSAPHQQKVQMYL